MSESELAPVKKLEARVKEGRNNFEGAERCLIDAKVKELVPAVENQESLRKFFAA